MRYGILADIHSNLAALEAVLEDIERRGGVDAMWYLGDLVGYGAEPNECLDRVRGFRHICVAGNHDWGAVGKVSLAEFNADAATACRWTGEVLSPQGIQYLKELPLVQKQDSFTLAHGSPRDPIWEYVLTPWEAKANFAILETPLCLVGHTHVPVLFEYVEARDQCLALELRVGEPVALHGRRLLFNPGSVGQPRDGDPRASYALYDDQQQTVVLRRVPYDIETSQKRILGAGLPPRLAMRLAFGR